MYSNKNLHSHKLFRKQVVQETISLQNIFNLLGEKLEKLSTQNSIPSKIIFKYENKAMTLLSKEELREFVVILEEKR